MGVVFQLKLDIIHWTVVNIHDIRSIKEWIVFYSLWKLSGESLFKLEFNLLCLLFDILLKVCQSFLSLLQKLVNNQQHRGKIGVFYNKLRSLKAITVFWNFRELLCQQFWLWKPTYGFWCFSFILFWITSLLFCGLSKK